MRHKILTGLKIGRLTVLDRNTTKEVFITKTRKNGTISTYKKCFYNCICECGNTTIIRTDNLIGKNKTYSCGCIQKEAARRNGKLSKKPFGEVPFNNVWTSYIRNAKLRNLKFDLSKEQFKIYLNSQCFYCGSPPFLKNYNQHTKDDYIIYNGIDRVNPIEGYNINNCVACCSTCNYVKNDLTQPEFYDIIKRIYNHNFKNDVHKI